MIRFRLCKTEIELRFGFFAVPALILCLGGETQLLPAVLACAVHEIGHLLAAYLCGAEIRRITFGALGIHMAGELEPLSRLRQAAVSLAGPLMNLLGFLLCLPLPLPYYAMQLWLFLFHILPALPLDGGIALCAVLSTGMEPRHAERFCMWLTILLAFLLGTLGFSVLLRAGHNFTFLAAALYILFYVVFKPCTVPV